MSEVKASSIYGAEVVPLTAGLFSFLHILIGLAYYESMSAEVIYGRPWWYDKLIYNSKILAL